MDPSECRHPLLTRDYRRKSFSRKDGTQDYHVTWWCCVCGGHGPPWCPRGLFIDPRALPLDDGKPTLTPNARDVLTPQVLESSGE